MVPGRVDLLSGFIPRLLDTAITLIRVVFVSFWMPLMPPAPPPPSMVALKLTRACEIRNYLLKSYYVLGILKRGR